MWPVILRELRAFSRRWTTYWLRLLAGIAVVVAIALWLGSPNSILVRQPGREVFLHMHRIILVAIWLVVPLMTADCLSREKREGTLGLLFLTNLRAWNIVFAKGIAAALTALTLWLSVIPIITVPVLLGGLPATEIALSCNLAMASICCALAAGLLASSIARSSAQAVALALTFSVVGHCALLLLVVVAEAQVPTFSFSPSFGSDPTRALFSGFWMVWNLYAPHVWTGAGMTRGTVAPLSSALLLIPLLSFLAACAVALAAAWQLRRNWQDKPKTKRQSEVEHFFCAPVFWTGLFRRWMQHSLARNPIGWLEKRSWAGRITSWIWLAVMISFASALAYSAATRDDFKGFNVLMWMLLVSIAYVAAGSFRRERETGALELILVTPLSERQIISGRLRGIWNQFLPTFAIWVAVILYLSSALKDWQVADIVRFSVAYLAVPVVGLYFSLRSRFVLLSWLATLAVCYVVPQLVWWAFYFITVLFFLSDWIPPKTAVAIVMVPALIAIAVFLRWRLHVNLCRRSFSLR